MNKWVNGIAMMLGWVFLIILATGCDGPTDKRLDQQNQGNLSVSEEKQRQIEAVVDEVMNSQKVPGVVMGIWQGDKEPFIITKGVADLASGRKISADDRFRIGSVSKTFEAIVIYQLCEESKLSLKDPVSKWLPDLPNGSDITVLRLLNMTAGVHDLTGDEGFSKKYFNEPQKPISRQEEYQFIINGKPDYKPGERCIYNDANYILLGMIIEQVSGNKVEDEIRNRVCIPLGLAQTELPVVAEISGQHSKGYRQGPAGELEEVQVDPSYAWAAGAMVSNLHDLKTYAKALYDGRLISAENRKTMQTWHLMSGYPNIYPHKVYSLIDIFYGGGIMNWGGLIGHNGTILGYNNLMAYIPSKDTTIIIWVNKCNDLPGEKPPVELMQDKIMNILYGEEYPFEGLPGI